MQPKSVVKASVVKDSKAPKRESEKKLSVKTSKVSGDTGNAYRVLLEPLVTEKNTLHGTYAFLIHPRANKQEVKKAIARVYGIAPVKVNIVRMKGKTVRWGTTYGQRAKTKKAIVTFPKGKKIEIV